jgi:hypothetical protein
MGEYEEYKKIRESNRHTFKLNFADDIAAFDTLFAQLRLAWSLLGAKRDSKGASHTGLLLFSNILIRHTVFGFENLACYQSSLARTTYRAGLEAFLIIGKFLDDPGSAQIWLNRTSSQKQDKKAYAKLFNGQALESKAIPRSVALRQVLGRLNDEFMLPNPFFTYRDASRHDDGTDLSLQIELFDTIRDIHEAHLVAFMNLFSVILEDSGKVVEALVGGVDLKRCSNVYEKTNLKRASQLTVRTPAASPSWRSLDFGGFEQTIR